MNWQNSFDVEAAPDAVFSTLVDIPSIAPCMPGAQLTGQTDDGGYEGTVKVKLGPISAQYRGKARLTETDPAARRAVMLAEGAETRGQGTASATITAVCRPAGTGTTVEIETDLRITGKVAQFGRGVIQDVSAKLIGQFADCLATSVLGGPGAADPDATPAAGTPLPDLGTTPAGASAEPATEATQTGAPASDAPVEDPKPSYTPPRPRPTPDAVDLGSVAGPAVAKRVIPLAAALIVLIIIWRAIRNRSAEA